MITSNKLKALLHPCDVHVLSRKSFDNITHNSRCAMCRQPYLEWHYMARYRCVGHNLIWKKYLEAGVKFLPYKR